MASKFQALKFLALITAVLAASVIFTRAQSAQMYRWVDEEGHTHYADKVPPQDSKYRRSKLNEQGFTVGVIEKNKTKQERERDKRLAGLRSAVQNLLTEYLSQDQTMLQTFKNEGEIEESYHAKMSTLEILKTVTRSNISRFESQKEAQQKLAAGFETSGKLVPDPVTEKIKEYQRHIDANQQKIAELEEQRKDLQMKMESDLKRFAALIHGNRGISLRGAEDQSYANVTAEDGLHILSMVNCQNEESCGKAWSLSKDYLLRYSSTAVRIETDTLIYTLTPGNDQDVALSLAKIKQHDQPGADLFLDVRCRQTSSGEELCASERVRDLLAGFRPYVTDRLYPE